MPTPLGGRLTFLRSYAMEAILAKRNAHTHGVNMHARVDLASLLIRKSDAAKSAIPHNLVRHGIASMNKEEADYAEQVQELLEKQLLRREGAALRADQDRTGARDHV